jgi:membrane protein YqaA with SNARE-associated domain
LSSLNWFSKAYDAVLRCSQHRHAERYLAAVSFIEASIFPIPPDVMLISMGLAAPKLSWRYALIATIFSVLGGILGYCIGMYAIQFIVPYVMNSSFSHQYQQAVSWFANSGIWVVILAGVTPFPYKIFAIAAGAMHVNFGIFVWGSIIGRGMRFFLVSGLLYFFGFKLEQKLRKYIDWIGLSVLVAIVSGFCIYRWVI